MPPHKIDLGMDCATNRPYNLSRGLLPAHDRARCPGAGREPILPTIIPFQQVKSAP
jgi:hypothetical protein